jgi:hypothetical protein
MPSPSHAQIIRPSYWASQRMPSAPALAVSLQAERQVGVSPDFSPYATERFAWCRRIRAAGFIAVTVRHLPLGGSRSFQKRGAS